jgi:putative hydrolase of HD superfamily
MNNLINFFHAAGKLKNIKRSGWKRHNISDPESVPDHSWRMALMALVLAKKSGLDGGRAVKLAVIHDVAESIVGDLVPGEVSPEEKQKKESDAVYELCNILAPDEEEFKELWEEYEFQKSPEAVLVKNIDRLEMALQAKEYEIEKRAGDLHDFMDSAEDFLKDDKMKKMLEIIKNLQANNK